MSEIDFQNIGKRARFYYQYQNFWEFLSHSPRNLDLCFSKFSKKRIQRRKNENDCSNDDDDKRIGVVEYFDGDVEQCTKWVQVGRESELRNDRARFRGEAAKSG